MNIVFVNACENWAGIKTWMREVAAFLDRKGHDVRIVCRDGDLFVQECKRLNLRCHPIQFGMDFSPQTIVWFWRLFRQAQTNIIVTNISKEIRTAGIAAKFLRIAHVNRLGNYGDLKPTMKNRLLYNGLVDRVFVPSQGLQEHFAGFDFLRDKVCYFPNAVTPPPLNIQDNPCAKFAVVAHLSKRKQVDKILLAFSHLQDLPWELHIGGNGPEFGTLREQANRLGLAHRVCFLGEVNPTQFLQDKDVGLLFSTQEGFPNVVVEYMAMSCAVIAADLPGTREIIASDNEGILIHHQDITALEQAIRGLIEHPQRRNALIRQGYEKVRTSFHQEVIYPRIEQEFERIICQKRSGSL
ncbi:glycosyl transferase [Candidatus Moduliflexus flocculans]|uniref:Glycosyl transferase n=1 Tax=Candidatus Moduliflexus flocculans TaxID=1499966 RepID=A0A081BP28_9BACT|nr:glycosyl transferase [Candidatus Moduliflexus flocculans]